LPSSAITHPRYLNVLTCSTLCPSIMILTVSQSFFEKDYGTVLISIIQFLISKNQFFISKNKLLISEIEFLILKIQFLISKNYFLISKIALWVGHDVKFFQWRGLAPGMARDRVQWRGCVHGTRPTPAIRAPPAIRGSPAIREKRTLRR